MFVSFYFFNGRGFVWFFFSSRRRHTRWPRDWSSDVCSSDLGPRCCEPSPRSSVGGPPTTGPRSPARSSPRWTTTCGSCSTNGPSIHIPTSPGGGGWTATSTGSTPHATTGGSSAITTVAPTCPSSPGPRSSDTRWSRGGRPPTTPPAPRTGPTVAADSTTDRSTCSSSPGSKPSGDAARCVEPCCCTPNANRSPPKSGSCGYAPPGWRSANSTSPPATARTINASSTPPANAAQPSRQDQHFCPQRLDDLLEPDVWKRTSPVLRGLRCSTAPELPG